MNEVTTIHLGRQSFTIAVDAQKALRAYLDAIKASVGDEDVLEEVELRMAELLAERGVTGDKVILVKDVDYLMEQLGDPKDFHEDDEPAAAAPKVEGKRLFRDTEGGLLAGVASGLANYFGLDVWIIRLIFLIGVFTGGWSILIYLALWIVVPEAKTSSDRLQMAGKPVTVQSLKEVVARADVPGAARRANATLAKPARKIFSILLGIIGLGIIIVGLSLIFALIALESYVVVHGGSIVAANVFPVGFKEHLLVHLAVAAGALIAVLIILLGLAIFKQKWPVRGWATGTLIGLTFIALAGSIALTADVAPRVHDRYNADIHTNVRTLPAFTSVKITGNNADVRFETASSYGVSMRYFDNPDLSSIKTTVANGVLTINTSNVNWRQNCSGFCLGEFHNLILTVESPTLPQVDTPSRPMIPDKPAPPEFQ